MGKYTAKRAKKNNVWMIIAIIVLSLLTALLIWVAKILEDNTIPELPQSIEQTDPVREYATESNAAETEAKPQKFEPFSLGEGLEVTLMGSYAGIYMEDGSDDIVKDVMMIVLKNCSDFDLQLARVDIVYADFVAEFEATNIPAGESVVLLEMSRRGYPGLDYKDAQVRNVVFFSEAMTLLEDQFEITTREGSIDVTNVSGADIHGDIYIYYKNSSSDLLYGGITYRARIEGGLAAGETARIITGHYDPENSRILNVVCAG